MVRRPGTFLCVRSRAEPRWLALAVALALTAPVVITLGMGPPSPAAGASRPESAVGQVTETYVDTTRDTPAWGPDPEIPSRTLVTLVLYPAVGPPSAAPVANDPPETSRGPYPLIVFSHGLGSTPLAYLHLLSAWAAAGFVVAAPRFPLSSSETPGGADAGDVVNQPADVRFVINAVLGDSAASTGPLAGLVDPQEIGAAGHSNGAITTLGLVADTCCQDPQVKAAVVMAGTTEGFPGGHYDLTHAPPLLLVHDTTDGLVPYRSAVIVYDHSRGPKGLLTIRGSTSPSLSGGSAHTAAAGIAGPAAPAVRRTTIDFFDAYLRGDRSALPRMRADGRSPYTALHLDPVPGGNQQVPVPPQPVVHLRATVTPHEGLTSGTTVTVRWSGYTAGKVVNVLECSHVDIAEASSAGCDLSNAKILQPDPSGHGTLTMQVVTGTVGNGTCDAAHPGCKIVVNNASSTDPADSVEIPITFST
jgi:dienelactone hydrolase